MNHEDEYHARMKDRLTHIVNMLKAQTAAITALQEEVKALRDKLEPTPPRLGRICDTCSHRHESCLSNACAPCFTTDTKPNWEPK